MSEPWRTSTVQAMLKGIHATHDWSALPILADALQDADYPHENKLEELRRPTIDPVYAQRLVCLLLGGEYEAAVDWLDGLALQLGSGSTTTYGGDDIKMTYADLLNAATHRLESGETTVQYGSDHWPDEMWGKSDEFWKHYCLVTGTDPGTINDEWGTPTIFSCSC